MRHQADRKFRKFRVLLVVALKHKDLFIAEFITMCKLAAHSCRQRAYPATEAWEDEREKNKGTTT